MVEVAEEGTKLPPLSALSQIVVLTVRKAIITIAIATMVIVTITRIKILILTTSGSGFRVWGLGFRGWSLASLLLAPNPKAPNRSR